MMFIIEGTVQEWLKQKGDLIKKGDEICTIETEV